MSVMGLQHMGLQHVGLQHMGLQRMGIASCCVRTTELCLCLAFGLSSQHNGYFKPVADALRLFRWCLWRLQISCRTCQPRF